MSDRLCASKVTVARTEPSRTTMIEQLRNHPELFERVRSILRITASAEGTVKKAGEVEALLIKEMRRLATMES